MTLVVNHCGMRSVNGRALRIRKLMAPFAGTAKLAYSRRLRLSPDWQLMDTLLVISSYYDPRFDFPQPRQYSPYGL
ncbi:hypothetical protein VTO42DRAFT_1609 [Malbranchea cinnamomea]